MYSDKAPMPNNWQSPFAELAYFIRNFFLRLTTNTFMPGIPNHSLHWLIDKFLWTLTKSTYERKIFIQNATVYRDTQRKLTAELKSRDKVW